MKKVIFLDLDGVLNSYVYDKLRDITKRNYIDETRLALLKNIVEKTNAEIIFSSTWRVHWDSNIEKCDSDGNYIVECFAKFGLKISDKTPHIDEGDRSDEIACYLKEHNDIYTYVIFDDGNFNWSDSMRNHIVKTNAFIGRGLEDRHAQQAIEILNKVKPKEE